MTIRSLEEPFWPAAKQIKPISIGLMLLLSALFTACQTRPQARSQVPYGAQGGPMMPQATPQQPTVWVRGDVKNQIIPWTEDLTLSRAIVAADYRSYFDPHLIVLMRQGQVYQITPRQLLSGKEDPVLQPGDVIELRR